IVRLRLFLDPERGALGPEHAGGHLDAASENLFRRLGPGELAARLQQGVCNLRSLELLRVEARLLQRDRELVRERCEQPLAVVVHVRDVHHDATCDAVALSKRRGAAVDERVTDARDARSVSNRRVAASTARPQISSTECARDTSSAKASSAFAPSASRRCCSYRRAFSSATDAWPASTSS